MLKCIIALSLAQAREVRQGFVRKVLGLVLLQLLVTAGASFAFLYVDPLKARSPNVYILPCMHSHRPVGLRAFTASLEQIRQPAARCVGFQAHAPASEVALITRS